MKSILITTIAIATILGCNGSKNAHSGSNPDKLNGAWTLNYLSSPGENWDSLYKNKKPEMNIVVADGRLSGTTSCNSFSGPVTIDGNKISFPESFAMTRMLCPGKGEAVFLETLKKVNTYSTDGKTLTLIMGDIAIMRFTKR